METCGIKKILSWLFVFLIQKWGTQQHRRWAPLKKALLLGSLTEVLQPSLTREGGRRPTKGTGHVVVPGFTARRHGSLAGDIYPPGENKEVGKCQGAGSKYAQMHHAYAYCSAVANVHAACTCMRAVHKVHGHDEYQSSISIISIQICKKCK